MGERRGREDGDVLIVRVAATPHRGRRREQDQGAGGKRTAIVRAATGLFLEHGYPATTTDQIATAAGVSKQTVYNQFGSKQALFSDIVLGVTATAEAFAAELGTALGGVADPDDVAPALRSVARRYLGAVMNPQVLALRRLVISEVLHLPDLAVAYYEQAPARVLAALADQLGYLADRGLLSIADPARAAQDFAFLVLGRSLDEEMFRRREDPFDPDALADIADHAVDVFLAAYRPEVSRAART